MIKKIFEIPQGSEHLPLTKAEKHGLAFLKFLKNR